MTQTPTWFTALQGAYGIFTDPMIMPLILFFCGLGAMLASGNFLIKWLRNKSWRKDQPSETWDVREDTPDTHRKKKGTPSMGGIGIIGSATLGYIAFLVTFALLSWDFIRRSGVTIPTGFGLFHFAASIFLVPLFVVAHAVLGFADDWSKASGRGGLRARAKLIGQIALAFGFVASWIYLMFTQTLTNVRYVLVESGWIFSTMPMMLFFIAFFALVIVATSNAVNLTDGIDGLAAGLCVQVGFGFLLASDFRAPLEIGLFSDLYWMALAGACLGFLFFNRFPARVFMGDTGSLALGAAVGIGAILTGTVLLLPFIGFVFWLEMGSVILQVLYFKYTKRKTGEGQRLFRRAPLHHHFEMGGWTEWRVVLTLWFVNFVAMAIGLALLHMGILPRFPY
jgi:phospho-N-acetylmuramoyl-pentapeptide-transferase